MIRKIIHIDEEKCNGCGLCANACHEGAIDMVNGKAKLVREHFCDGLGDCLPSCPMGAITFEEREAPAYDEKAVIKSQMEKKEKTGKMNDKNTMNDIQMAGNLQNTSNVQKSKEVRKTGNLQNTGDMQNVNDLQLRNDVQKMSGIQNTDGMRDMHTCPGSRAVWLGGNEKSVEKTPAAYPDPNANINQNVYPNVNKNQNSNTGANIYANPNVSGSVSRLNQWPCQIKLLPTRAPFYDGAKLLIAADCTAYAYANMHEDFMKGKITVIGCPKLDAVDYSEKLTEIIRDNDIRSVTIVRMEVPCCGGLQRAAQEALKASGKFIPWQVVTISRDGKVLDI